MISRMQTLDRNQFNLESNSDHPQSEILFCKDLRKLAGNSMAIRSVMVALCILLTAVHPTRVRNYLK